MWKILTFPLSEMKHSYGFVSLLGGLSRYHRAPHVPSRASSRELRIRVPTFCSVACFSRGTPPPKG